MHAPILRRMKMFRAPLFLCLVPLAGCVDPGGDYPRLLPTEAILAEPVLPPHAADAVTTPAAVGQTTTSRADALRAKADALRRPVIEPGYLSQMRRAQAAR